MGRVNNKIMAIGAIICAMNCVCGSTAYCENIKCDIGVWSKYLITIGDVIARNTQGNKEIGNDVSRAVYNEIKEYFKSLDNADSVNIELPSRGNRDIRAEKVYDENGLLIDTIKRNEDTGSNKVSMGAFKSYMSYKAVTNKSTRQYKMREISETTTRGLRVANGRVLVAIGTGYGAIVGDCIDIMLEDGTVIKAVMGEVKSDLHTDSSHKYHLSDKSIIEFIVDTSLLKSETKEKGNMSNEGFYGGVINVTKTGTNMLDTIAT